MWDWTRKWWIFYNYRGNWHSKGFASWPSNPRKRLVRNSAGYFLKMPQQCNELAEDSYMLSQKSGFSVVHIYNWWPVLYAIRDNTESAWVTSIIPDRKKCGNVAARAGRRWSIPQEAGVTIWLNVQVLQEPWISRKLSCTPLVQVTQAENHPVCSLEDTKQKTGVLPWETVTRAGRHERS